MSNLTVSEGLSDQEQAVLDMSDEEYWEYFERRSTGLDYPEAIE